MVSHVEALPVTFHEHPLVVVMLMVPVPPVLGIVTFVGETAKVQEAAAAWVIENATPPMVTDPLRVVVAVLAGTLNATEPEPVPPAALVIEIHDALLVADQVHPAVVVTAIVPLPPADPKA